MIKVFMAHKPDYDNNGTYNPDREHSTGFVRNVMRDSVEDALTDYLKANYDL